MKARRVPGPWSPGTPGTRRARRPALAASAAAAALLALAGCAGTGADVEPAAVDEEVAPAVPEQAEPASTCADLADDATYQATRELYGDADPAVFDAATAACAAEPASAWQDVYARTQEAAQYLSRLHEDIPLADADGYTFDLAVDIGLLSVAPDPSTQPPGVTAATRTASMRMQLVNTTPEREVVFEEVNGIISPLSYPTFLVAAAFEAGNPVCTVVRTTDSGCEWLLGFGRMESGLTLAPGQTYDLTVWAGAPNGGEASILLPGIPEDRWEEVRPHLEQPDGYRIYYSAGDNERFPSLCDGGDLPAHYVAPVLFQTVGCAQAAEG